MATRRLIALLLILWLPFQAAAGIVMPACVGHGPARIAAVALAAQDVAHAHAQHAEAAPTHLHGDPAQAPAHAHDHATADHGAPSVDRCGYCVVLCAACVPTQFVTRAHGIQNAAPAPHGANAFSSIAPSLAYKPPIAAAT